MKVYNILVPLADNQGILRRDRVTEFEAKLDALAGGYTIAPDVAGVWHDKDGKRYADTLRSYTIGVPEATLSVILDAAHHTFTDQTAIYVSEVGTFGLSFPGKRVTPLRFHAPKPDPVEAETKAAERGFVDDVREAFGLSVLDPASYGTGDKAPDLRDGWFDTLPREEDAAVRRVVSHERARVLYDDAPVLEQRLNDAARPLNKASWRLASAASALRKLWGDYRSNPGIGDFSADPQAVFRELQEATAQALAVLDDDPS